MTRSNTAILLLVIAMYTSPGIAQSADPAEELKACAKMTDREARLACLETLGERVLRDESADSTSARQQVAQPEAIPKATDTEPLPDDPDVSTLGNDQESNSTVYSGMITSCRKDAYGYWYFISENGQVWKEVRKRNRKFSECNFNVTITNDIFGYKMRIDTLEKTVRVKRLS